MRRRDAANTPLLRIQAHFAVPRTASGHLPTLRIAALRATAACIALVAIVFLAACGPTARVQPVLTERCLRLGGPRQVITVPITIRAAGLLHVSIRERGISAVAAAAANESGNGDGAASPIDRLGTITLAIDATAARVVLVRISSVDSRDITADVCVSAELVSPSDAENARAWREMAAGDGATGRRRWQDAFDRYLAAARLFDGLGMRDHAAAARHAMAELEYGYLQRRRDSIALISTTLARNQAAAPAIIGSRLALLARATMEPPEESAVPAQRVRELLSKAAASFRASGDGARELPRLKIFEGYLRYRVGDPNGARGLFDEAAAKCKALGDWECLAKSRQNLAALAEERQNFSTALADYEDAERMLDESRMPKLFADISDNLARLEGRAGLIHRSEQSARSAIELYARLGDCDGVRRSASTIGDLLVHVGSIGEAATYLDLAITPGCRALLDALTKRDIGARGHGFAEVSSGLRAANRVDSSLKCARYTATDDLSLEGSAAIFSALLARTEIARLDGEVADARQCLRLARLYAVESRNKVRLENANGALLLDEKRPHAAQTAFEQASRIARAARLAETSQYRVAAQLGLTQTALQSDRIEAARRLAYTALEASSARADISQVVEALRLLASADADSRQPELAIQTLRTAINLMELEPTGELDPDMRATYLATQHAVFAELTDLLVAAARARPENEEAALWDAFSTAEKGHARSLRYALEQASREHAPDSGLRSSDRYDRLMHAIADLARRNDTAQRSGELLQRIGQLALQRSPDEPTLDRDELERQLRSMNAVLVEYAVGRTEMFAFVLDGRHIRITALGSVDEIDSAARELSDSLRSAEQLPDRIRASARHLASLVLWPLTAHLSQRRILLVPEDSLHIVPFAVLPWSGTSPGELLVQHAELTSIPSALFVARHDLDQPPKAQSGNFVLIGDPVFRFNQWYRQCADPHTRSALPRAVVDSFDWLRPLPSLPGTRDEVQGIADLVRRWRSSANVDTLLRCRATPTALRRLAPDAELLHIATHGLIDARRPRLSSLALTPDSSPADGGAVQLLDILDSRLRARLVVLSACDTSSGRLLPGEGVLGLAQAFLEAGAASVLASYWRVEDSSTVRFMESFYRYMLVDRLPAAAALRRTQLDELAAGDSYDWAAFGLYGWPNSSL